VGARRALLLTVVLGLCALLAGCDPATRSASAPTRAAGVPSKGVEPSTGPSPGLDQVPAFSHIVVVVMEDHSYNAVIGNARAPFLNKLARAGLYLTDSVAVTSPSQPNYLALFSGSAQAITNDTCPHTITAPSLGGELIAAGLTFTGYSEGLPAPGYVGCRSGGYVREHNPWVNFPALPASVNQPFTAFPTDFAALSTVSLVVPDLTHDMDQGTVASADTWLRANVGAYADWALTHNSLLLITWDDGSSATSPRIPTILYGAELQPGTDSTPTTAYTLLRTIEAAYRLVPIGASATASALTADWQR
jgi:phosphatidylinositol-3-phosphatase